MEGTEQTNTPVKKTYSSQFWAVGRRKESSARVRILSPGTGIIKVNNRTFEDFFPREAHRIIIVSPLKLVKVDDKVDVSVNVAGGGTTGQAEATRHGIARALLKYDPSLRTTVKKAGFLTRDPRAKERKKYGRKRARKRFQFSKR